MNGPGSRSALALLLALGLLPGCGKAKMAGVLPANRRPTVELTQAPASTTQRYFYAYEIRWAGFDDDGTVDHFLYCVDPPSAAGVDTPWVRTTQNRGTFLFRSDIVDSSTAQTGHAYHTFVIKAVDNQGLPSAPAYRSFNTFTVAPSVQITVPIPDPRLMPIFGPSVRIRWTGVDPDGRTRRTPVKYKYKAFAEDNREFDFLTMALLPDSLRRYYAPAFAGWDSTGPDTTWADLTRLESNKRYIFVVVGFDEAGAYSPVLTFDTSMLYFAASYPNTVGPVMTLYNESFYYQFVSGQFSLDPQTFIQVDLPADQPLRFNWTARANSAGWVQGYRWKLDGDVGDETPRSNEISDRSHWSQWSVGTTGCNLPPVVPPPGTFNATHFLYVEAQDNENQLSLAVVRFNAIRPLFDHGLLFVDDTRLLPDHVVGGNTAAPSGLWPTVAELDTFFFAAGGFPWRAYPPGTLSPHGVFSGYAFDTLSTRFQPGGALTLNDLGRYRNIVWYVDYASVSNDLIPALLSYSFPGLSNPIATWVKQGGKLWLMGGGAAYSLQKQFEKKGSLPNVFSAADGELVPGRFLYEIVHWTNEVRIGSAAQAQMPAIMPGPASGAPDYGPLPPMLSSKTAATDPISVYAPNRKYPSEYYQTVFPADYVTKSNIIIEDIDPDPNVDQFVSTLDTLYTTAGGSAGFGRPIMTYYHGRLHTPVVYSGFPLWWFQRGQVIALSDFVLQNLWGLPRQNTPR